MARSQLSASFPIPARGYGTDRLVDRRSWNNHHADSSGSNYGGITIANIISEVIAPENELQALEGMARDYASGRYTNRSYIQRCFDEFEQHNKTPSPAVRTRLVAARANFEFGDAGQVHSTRSPTG